MGTLKCGSQREHVLWFCSLGIYGLLVLAACGGHDNPIIQPATDGIAPSVPQNFTAAATASTNVDLSWSASTDTGGSGLAGYRIYRNGVTTPIASVTTTVYSDTSVVGGTQYSYAVSAYDGAGNESATSAAQTVTTPGTAPVGGLDARPINTTCTAGAPPAGTITTQRVFPNLPAFTEPLLMLQRPGDTGYWYVAEKGGKVWYFDNTPTVASKSLFVDLSANVGDHSSEMGLLGMAFHPNFPADRRVFVSYTHAPAGGPITSRIASFTLSNDNLTLDPASEKILLSVQQPETNHNGGNIAFGPDGYLYIGFGDGGGGGDAHEPNGNGQTLTTLLGKLLRIDVSPGDRYDIPADNPFASNPQCSPQTTRAAAACPEIYAWGLRNPWRWSFDRTNGNLWVGDVGQNLYEEVDVVERGGNYGWRCREGKHDYNTANTPLCGSASLVDPLVEYDHGLGNSITGGYVYRGTQATNLVGRYIFGDFGSGTIWAWLPEISTGPTQLTMTSFNISSFGQGNDGELYVVDYSGGTLHHVVFQSSGGSSMPDRLADTGCFDMNDPTQPASGLIPYAINAPFWSDGAVKDRWLALPDNQTVAIPANGDWDLPMGTVLVKNFKVAGKLVETRLLLHYTDDSWGGFTYRWDDAQTAAMRVHGGLTATLNNGQTWIYPSESQCLECHTSAAGRSLGLETMQLNRTLLYPQTGRTANELTTLDAIGVLTPPLATNPASLPSIPDPTDTAVDLTQRARAYLHINCSQCHRPGGPTPSNLDLRYSVALDQTNACNAAPQAGDLGLGSSAKLIVPGNAALSLLVNRMNRRDSSQMPRIGSAMVDTAGVQLITDWVNQLTGCQ